MGLETAIYYNTDWGNRNDPKSYFIGRLPRQHFGFDAGTTVIRYHKIENLILGKSTPVSNCTFTLSQNGKRPRNNPDSSPKEVAIRLGRGYPFHIAFSGMQALDVLREIGENGGTIFATPNSVFKISPQHEALIEYIIQNSRAATTQTDVIIHDDLIKPTHEIGRNRAKEWKQRFEASGLKARLTSEQT